MHLRTLEQNISFYSEVNGNLRKNIIHFNYTFRCVGMDERKSNVVIIFIKQRVSRK